MTKSARTFYLLSGILSVALSGCSSPEDPALTFSIPQAGFEVVQQLPTDQRAGSGNPLYLPPREVTTEEFGSPELQLFVDSMYRVMRRTAGVGIAANQLGKRLQIFMIEAEADNPRYQVLGAVPKQVFINPKITSASKAVRNFWHGCLSAKGKLRGNVATHAWIEYTCQSMDGSTLIGRLDGFAAVIFQHEFRHMLGGTYLDHANHRVPKPKLDSLIASGVLPFFETCADTIPLLVSGYQLGESLTEFHQRVGTQP